MDKYGVQFDEDLVKEAEQQSFRFRFKNIKVCPKCGKPMLQSDQFLLWCSSCGTEPWEARPNK